MAAADPASPRIFLTGASSGLGEALARAWRRRHPDAVIALVARRSDRLAALAAELGAECTPTYTADVNDREALGRAAQDFLQRFGTPDIVVANAGISAGTAIGEPGDAEVFESVLRTNVLGLYDSLAPFVGPMRRRGAGRLVGIASVAGVRGLPGSAAYSASKAAAISCLESLRLELRGSGVRVITIAPGFIRTPMTARNPYPMPFLTDAEVFAAQALRVIGAGRSFAVIPRPMRVVAWVLRALPNALYDRMFARAPRKPRPSSGQ